MEFMNTFKNIIFGFFNNISFGINLSQILVFFILILITILFNSFIANFIVNRLKGFVNKTGNTIDDKLYQALIPPCKFLPIVIIFFVLSINFDKDTNLGFYFSKLNNSFATIFVFWFMNRLLIPFSVFFKKLEKSLSKALVDWIINSLKYLSIPLA